MDSSELEVISYIAMSQTGEVYTYRTCQSTHGTLSECDAQKERNHGKFEGNGYDAM